MDAEKLLEEVEKDENKKRQFTKPLKSREKEEEVSPEVEVYGKKEEEPKKEKTVNDRERWSHSEKKPKKEVKEKDEEPEVISNQKLKEKKKIDKIKEKLGGLLDLEDRQAVIKFAGSVAFYGVSLNTFALAVLGMDFTFISWIGWGVGAWIFENKLMAGLTRVMLAKSKQ